MRFDAVDTDQAREAMRGCQAAYYLIHSMLAVGSAYRAHDLQLAEDFAKSAKASGVRRIIYLGGLGETGEGLSEHLSSRREVERALQSAGVPVTVFRAAMIIGSGSASFEILRYLVARLPVMVTPKWVSTQCQPIAVRNVLYYLVQCLEVQETEGRTMDIGGPDILTYRQLMQCMAKALGLRKRVVIPVPLLTPRLSSLWIHMVTPIDSSIARPLAEGLRNRVVCRDNAAVSFMPQKLLGAREAIDAALGKHREGQAETSWSDAGVMPGDPDWAGGDSYEDRRTIEIKAPAAIVFKVLCQLGGENGYFSSPMLWRIRGILDRVLGGPGLSRGRRSREHVVYGDALDFWRVTRVDQDRALELRAEMRLPGVARLAFEIEKFTDNLDRVRLTQIAAFAPRGVLGHLYWWSVTPFHRSVFNGMLRGIRTRAE